MATDPIKPIDTKNIKIISISAELGYWDNFLAGLEYILKDKNLPDSQRVAVSQFKVRIQNNLRK